MSSLRRVELTRCAGVTSLAAKDAALATTTLVVLEWYLVLSTGLD